MADLPGKGQTVCVTGASGYIGSHIVKLLLQRGYTVRGTVRNANDNDKYGWLYDLAEGSSGVLELYSADLTNPGGYSLALRDCDYVIHSAAALKLKAADPQKEIVDITVEGTRNVFESILEHKKAKRVVLTSSVAAVFGGASDSHHMYTEEDWYTELKPGLEYNVAKTLSERLAWKLYEEQKKKKEEGVDGESWSFELTSICPGFVLGPILNKEHSKGSLSVLKGMMDGSDKFMVDLNFSVTNVKDVALAHVLCMEKDSAQGRYLVTEDKSDMSVLEIAGVIHKEYPACPVPTTVAPAWVLHWLVYFSPVLTTEFINFNAGKRALFSPQKAKDQLGLAITPAATTILEAAKSLIDLKVVPDFSAPQPSIFSFFRFGAVAPASASRT